MVTQSAESLEMLVMVSRLLSSKLDISELLVTIMRLSSRVVGAERASLYLLDEKTKELYFDVALGLPEDVQKMRFKLGEGIAGTCAQIGKSIISNDVQNDSRHTSKVDSESGFVTRSLLTCPMVIKGKVIGVVQAINKIEGEFTETDRNSFEAFASQAAIAIENSRLFSNVKEEKKKLEVIFRKIAEGAILTDKEGEIIILNNSASLYLEYEKYNYKNIKEIFSSFSIDLNLEDLISSGEYAKKFQLERDKPKKLILEVSAIKIDKENQSKSEVESILWIFSDITEKVMEERMARNFLSLISHKFKTPLAAINGFAQLLKDNSQQGNDIVKKASSSIFSQGQKLASLIDTLIDYTSIENLQENSIQSSEILVSSLFKEIISEHENMENKPTFKIILPEDFSIYADKTLVKKAIKQLVDNGIKFNKNAEKMIILSGMLKNDKKMLTVGDNGVGIPGEEIGKIFAKFYQIESFFTGQVEGWGLGLAMVNKIAQIHGGQVAVKSQLDKGSAFTIIFPK